MLPSRQQLTRHAFSALNRVVLPAVKSGIASPLPIGVGLVVLETTGRVSGQPREVPLVAVRRGRSVTVSTVRSASQWVKNLNARPDVAVWVGGRRRTGSSQVESGALTTASIALDD